MRVNHHVLRRATRALGTRCQPLTAIADAGPGEAANGEIGNDASMNWRVVSAPTRSHLAEHHAQIFGDNRSRESNRLRVECRIKQRAQIDQHGEIPLTDGTSQPFERASMSCHARRVAKAVNPH